MNGPEISHTVVPELISGRRNDMYAKKNYIYHNFANRGGFISTPPALYSLHQIPQLRLQAVIILLRFYLELFAPNRNFNG